MPLPDEVYRDLREEAARHDAIAAFAAENAGGPLDLDTELEAASVELLLAANKAKR
jgi:hypothetical protein